MKLGPLEVKLSRTGKPVEVVSDVQLAEQALAEVQRQRPRLGEIGATGTRIFGSLMVQQDYNNDLAGPLLYRVYDKMRKSDGQVRAGLSVIKLPLLRADWSIEPASDSAQDKEIAKFLEDDLIRGMSSPWSKVLRQIMLALDYGSMTFETVWEIQDDNMVHLRKLAPRLPSTITKWRVDENGGLTGIEQMALKGTRSELIDIPVEKLVLFINEQEGSDFKGTSVLRAAYKHWYIKDKLYIVDAIAKEKRSMGVDVGTLYGAVDEDRKRDAEAALMGMHAHEKQFMTEIDGEFTYRLEGVQGRFTEALASIEHHDSRILRSILAEFLSMGERQSSSAAQGMRRDNSSFFMMALSAIGDEVICCTINEYLIKKWVDYNWTVKAYPRLVHSRLETRDILQLAGAVSRLMNVGAVTADNPTENALRGYLELPLIDESMDRPQPMPKTPVDTPPQPVVPNNPNKPANVTDIKKVAASLDAVRKEQAVRLSQVGSDIFSKGQWSRVEDVNVPYRSKATESVMRILLELSPPTAARSVALEARLLVDYSADRMRGEFVDIMKGTTTHYDVDAMQERLLRTPVSESLIAEAIARVNT